MLPAAHQTCVDTLVHPALKQETKRSDSQFSCFLMLFSVETEPKDCHYMVQISKPELTEASKVGVHHYEAFLASQQQGISHSHQQNGNQVGEEQPKVHIHNFLGKKIADTLHMPRDSLMQAKIKVFLN
jgi:hypothetical protein